MPLPHDFNCELEPSCPVKINLLSELRDKERELIEVKEELSKLKQRYSIK